ncbi:MAG: hypothetical protein CMB99_09690 [Flavobacteriaceae bacterium]|nr:hypothetical protein [Flavobacteriaceae bacterium]
MGRNFLQKPHFQIRKFFKIRQFFECKITYFQNLLNLTKSIASIFYIKVMLFLNDPILKEPNRTGFSTVKSRDD